MSDIKRYDQDPNSYCINESENGNIIFYIDHLSDKQVNKDKLIEALALIYNRKSPMSPFSAVADACDDFLDKSGALLGEVRDKAMELSQEPTKDSKG